MIVLDLACSADHRFEGWFGSADAFREQMAAAMVACPHCGDTHLRQLPSAPHLARPARPPAAEPLPMSGDELGRLLRALAEGSDDVGGRFPEEARRIHYREAPPRNIRGVASIDETLELLEEGVDILPLPIPPKGETH